MRVVKRFNLITGLVLVAFTATGFAANDKLDKKLKAKANGGGNETVSVIVQYHAMPDTAENGRLANLNAQTKRSYSALSMRALEIKAHKLDKLADHPRVKFVTLDGDVESFTTAARQTANQPSSGKDSKLDGTNITVAVIDSGIAAHHNVESSRNIEQFDFLNGNQPGPSDIAPLSDPFGHGTHVPPVSG